MSALDKLRPACGTCAACLAGTRYLCAAIAREKTEVDDASTIECARCGEALTVPAFVAEFAKRHARGVQCDECRAGRQTNSRQHWSD